MTRQPLWVILCHLPAKGRREIEETIEEIKERDISSRFLEGYEKNVKEIHVDEKRALTPELASNYLIYPKYWDTLSTYHTCPKI